MAQNCIERMKENHTDEKIASFRIKQQQSYEFKRLIHMQEHGNFTMSAERAD